METEHKLSWLLNKGSESDFQMLPERRPGKLGAVRANDLLGSVLKHGEIDSSPDNDWISGENNYGLKVLRSKQVVKPEFRFFRSRIHSPLTTTVYNLTKESVYLGFINVVKFNQKLSLPHFWILFKTRNITYRPVRCMISNKFTNTCVLAVLHSTCS